MPLGVLYTWLDAASVLVIIGVILEGEELIAEFRIKGWRPIWPKIGFGLLVIGLAAEVLLQTRIESADAALKRASDNKILELETAASPRDVLGQPKTFVLAFAGESEHSCISVNSYAFDAEGARLANEIIRQLRKMNFVVADNTLTDSAQTPMAFGIYVSGPNASLVNELIMWLNNSNLQAIVHAPPPSTMTLGGQTFTNCNEQAEIFVGSKPILPLISN